MNKTFGQIASIMIFLCLLFLSTVAIYSLATYGTVIPIPSTCYVGITGTAATVTITAINAEKYCKGFTSLHYAHPGASFYELSSPPSGNELCEGDYSGSDFSGRNVSFHYLVRDTGLFNIFGTSLCMYFTGSVSSGASQTPIDTPTPTPTPTDTPIPQPLLTFHGHGNASPSFTVSSMWVPWWSCTGGNADITIQVDDGNGIGNGTSNTVPCDGFEDHEWIDPQCSGSYHVNVTTQGDWVLFIQPVTPDTGIPC